MLVVTTPILVSTSATNIHFGWTAGAGAAYAFTDRWIGQIEVGYSNFGTQAYQTTDGPVNVSWEQVVASAGISYKY